MNSSINTTATLQHMYNSILTEHIWAAVVETQLLMKIINIKIAYWNLSDTLLKLNLNGSSSIEANAGRQYVTGTFKYGSLNIVVKRANFVVEQFSNIGRHLKLDFADDR